MNFMELIKTRYSCRKFDKRPVEQEKIDMILEAARFAPTAANRQPQRIMVIKKDKIELLKNCTPYHFDAPVTFLVCYDRTASWKRKYDGRDSGEVDASIVGTQMMLAASEAGIGSTWVMSFDPKAIREAFHLPEEYEPVALFPMGYPAKDAEPGSNHAKRFPIETMVFGES